MRFGENIADAIKKTIKDEIEKDLNEMTGNKSRGSGAKNEKRAGSKEKPDSDSAKTKSEKRESGTVENWEQWEQAIVEAAYASVQRIETMSLRLGDEILKKHLQELEPHVRSAFFLLFENGESVPHTFTGYKGMLTGCRYKVRDCIDYFHKENKVDPETDEFKGDPSILARLLAEVGQLESKLKEIAETEGKIESKGLGLDSVPPELKKSILSQCEEGINVISVEMYRSDESGYNMAKVETAEKTYYFTYEYDFWRYFESKTKEEEKKEIEVEEFVRKRFFAAAEEISRMLQSMPAEERAKIVYRPEEVKFLENNNWDFTKWAEKILNDHTERRNEEIRRNGHSFDNALAQAAEEIFRYKRELDKYLYDLEFNPEWNNADQDKIEEDKDKNEKNIYNKKGQLVYHRKHDDWESGEGYESVSGNDTREHGYSYDENGNISEVRFRHEFYSEGSEYNPSFGTNYKKAKTTYENGRVSQIHIDRKEFYTNQQNGFAAKNFSEKDVGHRFENLFESSNLESSEDIYISYDTSGKVSKIERKGIEKTKYFDGDMEENIEEVIYDNARDGDKSEEEVEKMINDIMMLKKADDNF